VIFKGQKGKTGGEGQAEKQFGYLVIIYGDIEITVCIYYSR